MVGQIMAGDQMRRTAQTDSDRLVKPPVSKVGGGRDLPRCILQSMRRGICLDGWAGG
ncbi:hypothetical protein [Palleronia caenipelagi]|uniref:hypothetical protein n=1 Tax=Palleronia caenipelagi TaxID=2489174 RepID=UPI00163D9064|nr:hypothetical protein [Palleronia caenipelagi]